MERSSAGAGCLEGAVPGRNGDILRTELGQADPAVHNFKETGHQFFIPVPFFYDYYEPHRRFRIGPNIMQDFAGTTGLDPHGVGRRYLWTDAFAVCNYLGLFRRSGDPALRELALRLIDRVHSTLGRHCDDDTRAGWIGGLLPEEGKLHPAIGGLRIGKSLPERGAGEPYNEQREWDRDMQYYLYLTKWMHALGRAERVTGNPVYIRWIVELARTAHACSRTVPVAECGCTGR